MPVCQLRRDAAAGGLQTRMQTADSRSTRSGTFNPRAWVTCPAATNHSRIFGRMIVPAYNCNPKNRRRSGCCGLLYGTPTFSALAPSYHAVVATQSWSEHGFESSEMSCLRTKTPQVLICHSRFFFFFFFLISFVAAATYHNTGLLGNGPAIQTGCNPLRHATWGILQSHPHVPPSTI